MAKFCTRLHADHVQEMCWVLCLWVVVSKRMTFFFKKCVHAAVCSGNRSVGEPVGSRPIPAGWLAGWLHAGPLQWRDLSGKRLVPNNGNAAVQILFYKWKGRIGNGKWNRRGCSYAPEWWSKCYYLHDWPLWCRYKYESVGGWGSELVKGRRGRCAPHISLWHWKKKRYAERITQGSAARSQGQRATVAYEFDI